MLVDFACEISRMRVLERMKFWPTITLGMFVGGGWSYNVIIYRTMPAVLMGTKPFFCSATVCVCFVIGIDLFILLAIEKLVEGIVFMAFLNFKSEIELNCATGYRSPQTYILPGLCAER